MKILLLTRYDRKGASSRLRSLQYLPFLRSLGWKVDVTSLFSNEYLERVYAGKRYAALILSGYFNRVKVLTRAGRYDLLWIEKELFPYLPLLMERFLSRLNVPYIVDYDDALFHKYDRHSFWLIRALLGRKIDSVMRHAALVVTGNSYLADRARAAGVRKIEILPTVVDVSRYKVTKMSANNRLTVGWVGSPATAKYLTLIGKVLARVQRDHGVRVSFIGSGPVQIGNVCCDVTEWQESLEPDLISALDIGLMPLPDGPWERGKCGYKLIQYMACGLPVIASPVGVNCEIVRSGVNGFLANTLEDWEEALNVLIKDPVLRCRMGVAGRSLVESQYSLKSQASRLEAMIRSVLP